MTASLPSADAAGAFVRQVVRAWMANESLLRALTPPIRVPVPEAMASRKPAAERESTAQLQSVFDAVSNATSMPSVLVVPNATKVSSFEVILGLRLAPDVAHAWKDIEDPAAWFDCLPELVADARAQSFAATFKRTNVRSFDGVAVRSYSAGEGHRAAVVIVPPCGMPAELCEAWLVALSDTYAVVIAETRGLFGPGVAETLPSADVGAQVQDIVALLDHYGISVCHLMGICGGAVPALMAAAGRDKRIRSVSTWHGDFELGAESPQTTYQQELRVLSALAAQSVESARPVHEVFRSPRILQAVRADLAHLLLYPYANPELMFRYATLNGAIMRTDVSTVLPDVEQPTLVVTSRDDQTTHPEGSLRVAEKLPQATLHIEPTGDHLSAFDAKPASAALLKAFLSAHA